ncbi:hypothetical protein LIER_29817 [Lithospermum erythrorhizon]|uniref:Chlorophyllase n=1 Tax=Lithospermum erythrorhizon TaxID=34254 RepID=A0AAV3RRD3_LITER
MSHSIYNQLLMISIQDQNVGSIFPVLLFFHGFLVENAWYTQLLEHVSSHVYIIVAPQEVNQAAFISEWLIKGGLSSEPKMPKNVQADLTKVAVSGHSRGGKTAFALALGCQEAEAPPASSLKFSAVLGIDPVAGSSPSNRTDPKILKYIPRSFDLSTMPIAVIGTGLGNQKKGITPPLAPNGVNHAEFWNESKPPCYYFLAKEYGHCDMFNEDGPPWFVIHKICQTGSGPRDLMRRSLGGIVVAFLEAYLGGNKQNLQGIVDESLEAPIAIHPIISLDDATC